MIQTILLLAAMLSPACSMIVTCSFRELSFSTVGIRYSCNIDGIQNPEIVEVTKIVGTHLSGRSNIDVEGFLRNNAGFLFVPFPRSLETFFPNLDAILLWSVGLTSISSGDLLPWPKLAYLSIYDNSIQTVDGDLLQNSLKLRHVNFDQNLIRNVGVGLLSNLNELEYVNFNRNPCINAVATSPQSIESLKVQLIAQCPPMEELETTTVTVSTTTADSCAANLCSINDEVEDLRAVAEELRLFAMEQAKRIEELSLFAMQQVNTNDEQAKRIEELEKNVREMSSNPCSCSP